MLTDRTGGSRHEDERVPGPGFDSMASDPSRLPKGGRGFARKAPLRELAEAND